MSSIVHMIVQQIGDGLVVLGATCPIDITYVRSPAGAQELPVNVSPVRGAKKIQVRPSDENARWARNTADDWRAVEVQQAVKVGSRVRLHDELDIHHLGFFAAGLRGTVVELLQPSDPSAPIAAVKLDTACPDLAEWDNCLQVFDPAYGEVTWAFFDVLDHPAAEQIIVMFPDYPLHTLPLDIPFFAKAVPWKNDSCPIWEANDAAWPVCLSIDFPDPADSEIRGDRYCIWLRADAETGLTAGRNTVLASTDSWAEAKVVLWTCYFGGAIHPDNAGASYVTGDGSRALTDEQAAAYDRDMAEPMGRDVYELIFEVWRLVGFIAPHEG